MVPPFVIALALVVALVALLPARRLQLAGLEPRLIGGYTTLLWIGGMLVILAPGATRWLVPILMITWLGPFVVAPERLNRVLRRGGPPAGPIKNVTPPDEPGRPLDTP